ncbi:MAG: DUF2971 domain-containing protein [Nitrososphaerota archaeon]|nr:DUF2971 domain-containing protein [Nitrososphaerota archaeon]
MSIYKKRKKLQTLLALCFTDSPETNHHWHVFASGAAGVCITFNKDKLIGEFEKVRDTCGKDCIRCHAVKYLRIDALRDTRPLVSDLPFLKRLPYEPEQEFRVIYECKNKEMEFWDVQISLSCIDSIALSPQLHQSIRASVIARLRAIPECPKRITRTTLQENNLWKRYGEEARD